MEIRRYTSGSTDKRCNRLIPAMAIVLLIAFFMSVSFPFVLSMQLRAEGSKDADQIYTNPDSGYDAVIYDRADKLSASEEKDLIEVMQPLTDYGNAVFYSISETDMQPAAKSESLYAELYGGKTVSGTLFLIDMQNRELYLYNAGAEGDDFSYKITSSKSNTIMDNVYRYASDGDYYKCAENTYRQILRV